ncbi:MAG: toll/interleukin-1 receptor domain-containing protein [Clostridiales bacterium]|nr:toll/interleukin-1 receptor domain-containing protein [Clostridiales bacterium]
MEAAFDAFISYSHRDILAAKRLQRSLEAFRIPKEMREELQGRTRFRVFRDQTDLAGTELQAALRRELEASRFLIVLCSPSAAASVWVNEEVSFFQALGRRAQVIPFIISGEPESDQEALECYPPALRGGADHALGANVQEIGWKKAFLKLVSILLGVRFNRLVDRDRQRRRRTALTAVAVSLVVATVVGVLLVRNAKIRQENDRLSFDIYGAALLSFAQKDVYGPGDVAFLETSARAGNVRAMLFLADCYLHGKGTETDEAAAFSWYLRAAEAGDTSGMIAVSNAYRYAQGTQENPEQSYLWSLRAAEAGNPAGMLNVGIDCEGGYGTEQNGTKALEWYRRSADAEDSLGMYNLARCYLTGVGTEADREKAFYWTLKLAERGEPTAMYNVAAMYENAFGTEENPRKAYLWYRRSAEAGDADGMYMTGVCLETQYGVTSEAAEWYQRAAEAGSEKALEKLDAKK